MNLPQIIAELLTAQTNFNSEEYAKCFSETAFVFDEGETYKGQDAIRVWNDQANETYKTILEPVECCTTGNSVILKAKVSGTFEGSPIILTYHFELNNEKIAALKITG